MAARASAGTSRRSTSTAPVSATSQLKLSEDRGECIYTAAVRGRGRRSRATRRTTILHKLALDLNENLPEIYLWQPNYLHVYSETAGWRLRHLPQRARVVPEDPRLDLRAVSQIGPARLTQRAGAHRPPPVHRIGGPVGAYILRRMLISIPVLLGITIIGFVALKLTPGDPLLASVNPEVLANLMSHPGDARGGAPAARASTSRSSPTSTCAGWATSSRATSATRSRSQRPIVDEIGARLPQTLFLMVIGADDGRSASASRSASSPPFASTRRSTTRLNAAGDLPGLDARVRPRPRSSIYVFAVNLHWLPTEPAAHRRAGQTLRDCAPPPDPARDRARDRQRRAARPLHAREHARRAQQRVRHDRPLEGPRRRGS